MLALELQADGDLEGVVRQLSLAAEADYWPAFGELGMLLVELGVDEEALASQGRNLWWRSW